MPEQASGTALAIIMVYKTQSGEPVMTNLHSRRGFVVSAASLAAASALFSAPAYSATRYITIGTGGTGGVYYPYGGGLAQLLSKKLADTQATAEVTGGSVDNVKLLGSGSAEIGFSTVDSAY